MVAVPDMHRHVLKYNLQLFAKDGPGGEKTEPATQKKLDDARKDGKVAKSKDVVSAITLMLFFALLKTICGMMSEEFNDSFKSTYNMISSYGRNGGADINYNTVSAVIQNALFDLALMVLPIMLVIMIIEIVGNIYQVKWKITGKPLMPKFSKLNPISGFKRLFSLQSIVTLIKSIAILSICIYIVYLTIVDKKAWLFNLYEVSLPQALVLTGDLIVELGIKISAVYLIVGFADYVYQKRKFNEDMKMTKQEVRDEYKETEGDPQIKGQIRRRMREVSQRRMMQSVPQADVVITNPTHYAVALKYDSEKSQAPVVLAKGTDFLAQKIKEVARENQIIIYEDRPLARALYGSVEVGEEIPQELYQAVAEVIAYVYKLNHKAN